jgi:cysteinyl-tRNA synthetase
MSKSKGNFYTLRDLLDRGATAAAVRLELIKTHYRSNANFTMQGLKDSQRQIDRWRRLKDWLTEHNDVAAKPDGPLALAKEQFLAALCDDLNVAGAIGVLNEAVNVYTIDTDPEAKGSSTLQEELSALLEMDQLLGVFDLETKASLGDLDVPKIDSLIEARLAARDEKKWGRADEIRDELLGMGVAIKDDPEGTTWSKIVQ